MSLLSFGINHKTAPIAVREQVAFASDQVEHALHLLTADAAVLGAAILSTCNRTELYLSLDEEEPKIDVLAWLADFHQVTDRELAPHVYAHTDQVNVKRGDTVRRGQVIATVGASGSVAAPQLHFEIRRGTEAVNPTPLLRDGPV